MKQYEKVFDPLYYNMVEAGETGGILDTILQRLSSYIEKNVKLKRAVKSAMIYPVSVIDHRGVRDHAAAVEGRADFRHPVQRIGRRSSPAHAHRHRAEQFRREHLRADDFLLHRSAAAFAIKFWYGTPQGRFTIDGLLLKVPVVGLGAAQNRRGALHANSRHADFERRSHSRRSDITARTSGNAVVEKAIAQTRKAVEAGRSLVDPLKETDVFPGMVTQMIGVGEQTGAMDAMLQKIADFYEDEVDAAVKDMLTAIEPIMIVFLGVVVGGVVISMYLPLFSLIGKLSGH